MPHCSTAVNLGVFYREFKLANTFSYYLILFYFWRVEKYHLLKIYRCASILCVCRPWRDPLFRPQRPPYRPWMLA
jgi:hypothetical protein